MSKDKFIDRLMIPICDDKSRVVGFTARVFPFDQNPNRPKYLNSAESDIFKKTNILFGLDKSIKEIRQDRWLIIVEGNMDVISAHRYNLKNIIASQGTSFTDNQVRLLKRTRAEKILLAFDNDNAGIISSRKLFLKLINNGFEVLKLVIPDKYKDIDDYLPDLSKEIILNDASYNDFKSLDYMEFELNMIADKLQSSKNEIVRSTIYEFIETLSQCPEIIQDQYISKLSDISKIGENTLSKILEEVKSKNSNISSNIEIDDNDPNIEESILSSVKKINIDSGITGIQKLIAMSYKQKLDQKMDNKLRFGYKLMQFLHPERFKPLDIDDFKSENSNMLEMIYSNIKEINFTEKIITFNKLKDYIRKNENIIFTDSQQKKQYLLFFSN